MKSPILQQAVGELMRILDDLHKDRSDAKVSFELSVTAGGICRASTSVTRKIEAAD